MIRRWLWISLALWLPWPSAGECQTGAAPPPQAVQSYAGRFTGEDIAVELEGSGERYRGVIRLDGESFSVTARDTGERLEGSFEDEGERFAFTATLDGSKLRLTTDGDTYELDRQRTNPLARRRANPVPPGSAGAAAEGGDRPSPSGHAGRAPDGYQARQEGSGRVLIAHKKGARSARALLDTAMDDMARHFDARPQASGAFADRQDREAQASFLATVNARPVSGLVFAGAGEGGGNVVVLYDSPEALSASLGRLVELAREGLPRGPAEPARWQQVSLPDGSGSMRLPEGWRIFSANKGMVDVEGPDGALGSFGIWVPVSTPESVLPQYRDMLVVAPYSAPAEAVVQLWDQLNRLIVQGGGDPSRFVRIVEQTPTPYPNGQAAFLHFEADRITGGRPVRYHALALVITAVTSPSTWMYYFSQVAAPEPVFGEKLPVMLEIWKSWKVSDAELRRRIDDAMDKLREANALYQSARENRERVMDNALADWAETTRGTRYERDTLTGEMRVQPLHEIKDIVEEKNRVAGYERYEQVPLRDLNQP